MAFENSRCKEKGIYHGGEKFQYLDYNRLMAKKEPHWENVQVTGT